jgi:Protein of unknown function (DUF1360)
MNKPATSPLTSPRERRSTDGAQPPTADESLADRVRSEAEAYQHGHDQPLTGYAAAMALFASGCVAARAGLALTSRELPDSYRPSDLVLGALAVHKLTRIISKESVASPLRVPFTRFTGDANSAELTEEVRASGARRSAGELLTCPFCLAPWLSTSYVVGLAAAPRTTRAAAAIFSLVFGSDVLQHAYSRLLEPQG